MRDDYGKFEAQGASIVVVAPHDADRMRAYWTEHGLPFIGVPDPENKAGDLYGQQWKLFKLGRMPAQLIIDCEQRIAFAHYASGMSDIPSNEEMLKIIREIGPCGGGEAE